MSERTELRVIDGEARLSDRHICEALGFTRISSLHRLIKTRWDELEDFGEVFHFEVENPSAAGGRPTKSYLLNEHQATAICLWAETAKARSARKQIVEVFTRWRRGEAPLAAPAVDPFEAVRARNATVFATLGATGLGDDPILRLTHLPIWANGRRPAWWGDLDLRAFLTASHRQMTLAVCCAEVERRFGRTFSASTLQRYWAQLDRAFGPRAA